MTARRARFPGLAWVLILPGALATAISQAQAVQYWPEIDISVTVNRVNLFVPSLVRVASGAANPQFVATGAVGTFSFNPHWSVSAGYLFADLPQKNGTAHVPLLAVTGSTNRGRWYLSDVNRVERLVAYADEPYRYRNRATADFALGKAKATHLYVSDEYFVNLSARSWNQNRAQLGLGRALNGSMRLDVYFLERGAPGGSETPVAGSVLTIRPRPHIRPAR